MPGRPEQPREASMIRYKVQNRYIKHGFIDNAEDKIEEAIQPVLDDGTKNGWTLHSFQATTAAKGTNLVFIWQLPD
jgi:hypothetical protein